MVVKKYSKPLIKEKKVKINQFMANGRFSDSYNSIVPNVYAITVGSCYGTCSGFCFPSPVNSGAMCH